MKRLTLWFTMLFVVLSLFIVTVGTASAATISKGLNPTSGFPGVPSGYAYAIYAVVPSGTGSVIYGPNIPAGLNCTTPPTTNTVTNSGAIIQVNPLINSGTATSMVTINRTATSLNVQSTETIQNLKLLGGLITANALTANVSSTVSASGATSTNSSQFTALSVAGVPVLVNPAPNTILSIPLVGTVTLNEQSGPFNGATSTSISAIMLDVHVTLTNLLGFPVGTRIVVAYAQSGTQPMAVSATAYGLYALALGGSVPAVGPVAATGISCKGGSATNTVSLLNVPIVGTTGVETSSASGHITPSDSNATSRNNIATANLLNSFLTVDAITTTATVDLNSTTGSSSGSTVFVNAKLAGIALSSNPAPNTRVNLLGIGYAIVNEQYGSNSTTSAAKTVIGLDIFVTLANNSLNLPIGARIIVSLATASVARY